MKIIDVHRFNRKLQMLNEWSNFKHKIANIVSKIIKKLAIKIKDDYDFLSGNTDLITISNFVKYHIKKKEKFNISFVIDDIPTRDLIFNFTMRKSDISKMDGDLTLNYIKNFSLLTVYFPFIENEEDLNNYIKNNFLREMKGNINHELTHYFDRNSSYKDEEYNPGSSSKSLLDYFLYLTQKIEIKAIIQELISIIHSKNKRNKQTKENDISLKELISERFKFSFRVLTENSFLEKYFLSCYVSYVFNEKTLKERYWKFLISEKDISEYICSKDKIFEIKESLIKLNKFINDYKLNLIKKKIFEDKNKIDDIILYLESDFFNNLKMDIKNFSTEELFSKFSDYYIKNFILS